MTVLSENLLNWFADGKFKGRPERTRVLGFLQTLNVSSVLTTESLALELHFGPSEAARLVTSLVDWGVLEVLTPQPCPACAAIVKHPKVSCESCGVSFKDSPTALQWVPIVALPENAAGRKEHRLQSESRLLRAHLALDDAYWICVDLIGSVELNRAQRLGEAARRFLFQHVLFPLSNRYAAFIVLHDDDRGGDSATAFALDAGAAVQYVFDVASAIKRWHHQYEEDVGRGEDIPALHVRAHVVRIPKDASTTSYDFGKPRPCGEHIDFAYRVAHLAIDRKFEKRAGAWAVAGYFDAHLDDWLPPQALQVSILRNKWKIAKPGKAEEESRSFPARYLHLPTV